MVSVGRAASTIIILCLLLVPVGALILGGLSGNGGAPDSTASVPNTNDLSLESHEPISIWSDAAFASLADQEGWSGNGTHETPYVIEEYQIQAGIYGSCIEVQDVESHFVIRSCDLSSGGDGTGIYVMHAPNGRIESCIIHSVGWGIHVWSSSGMIIYDNTIHDAFGGVVLGESSGCIVESNHLTNCSLELYGSTPDQWLHNVSANYVNGNQLGYFREQSSVTIDASSYGQLILTHCQNVRVQNGVFYGIGTGITLGYCQGCVITDCESVANWVGVYVDHCNGGVINGCHIGHNDYFGIQLNQSSFCNVTRSVLDWNSMNGVVAMDSPLILTNNSISYSYMGVQLANCSQSRVWDNEISHNQVGANVLWSGNVSFEANTFSHNSEYGLDFYEDCYNCHVYYNRFFGNWIENARDNGGPNTWDDGFDTGNYWSDYLGDGVYTISGSALSVDRYPMQLPYTTTTATTTTTTTTAATTTTTTVTSTTTTSTTGQSSTVTTTSNATGTGSIGVVTAAVTGGSATIIVLLGYTLLRNRRLRDYQ